jgi:PAS domain S-box-containing protein
MMSSGKIFKLLVVDDDQQSILILKQIFKALPYEVITAESGNQALELATRQLPDLILLDILMPDISGLEVCRNLQQDAITRHIPIIFITALSQKEELVKGFQAGAVDYIIKPYQKEELRARVENHLKLKHSGDVIAHQNLMLQREIEHRRQMEEKFRALSQAAFEAVFFLKSQQIIETNDAATQVFGYLPEEFTSLQVSRLVPNPDAKKLQAVLKENDHGPWEMLFQRKDRSTFFGQVKQQEFEYRKEKITVLAISDISRLKELEQEVRNAIIDTEEKERKRFAMDLHDGLGALLSTLKIYVTLLQKADKSDEDKEFLLNELKTNINEAVASARRIANNLMPSTLDDYGLLPTLESFCQKVLRSGAINIHIDSPRDFPRLERNMEINLYRIFTELINNTLKHAQASNIYMKLNIEDGLLNITYQDDGVGFDFDKTFGNNQGSHGLKNIKTRLQFLNGSIKTNSPEGGGVVFDFEMPVS